LGNADPKRHHTIVSSSEHEYKLNQITTNNKKVSSKIDPKQARMEAGIVKNKKTSNIGVKGSLNKSIVEGKKTLNKTTLVKKSEVKDKLSIINLTLGTKNEMNWSFNNIPAEIAKPIIKEPRKIVINKKNEFSENNKECLRIMCQSQYLLY